MSRSGLHFREVICSSVTPGRWNSFSDSLDAESKRIIHRSTCPGNEKIVIVGRSFNRCPINVFVRKWKRFFHRNPTEHSANHWREEQSPASSFENRQFFSDELLTAVRRPALTSTVTPRLGPSAFRFSEVDDTGWFVPNFPGSRVPYPTDKPAAVTDSISPSRSTRPAQFTRPLIYNSVVVTPFPSHTRCGLHRFGTHALPTDPSEITARVSCGHPNNYFYNT